MDRLLDPDANPYLDLWNWLLEVVRGGHGTPFDWYATLTADSTARTNVLLIVALLVLLYIRMGGGLGRHRADPRERYASRDDDKDAKRPDNVLIWRRLLWRIRPPSDTMRVDGLVIDRSRKPHCAWLAPTGGGKSASVATIRLNGQRATLAVTPDLSDPLVDATHRLGGFRWTACVSTTPINFLIGTPTEVAERLTEVFRSGGVGAWKRVARRATADVIRQIDAEDEPRALRLIGERLEQAVRADRDLRTVCAGWVARFLDLADQFGDSIGPAGIDLADLLRNGQTVLLDNDSFEHPSLGGDVVALGLAEAKRCASLVPSGFRLIFEEAGQLGERIDLAEPFFRAGRRRRIPVDVLTQTESDLNDGISSNIATRVYFAQELKALQKIAADRLGLDYRELDPATMKDFTAWVAHGKIRRLVRFPKPPTSRRPARSYDPEPTQHDYETPTARRMVITEHIAPPIELPGLPPPLFKVQEIIEQLDRSGECWLWLGRLDRDGYGLVWWEGQNRRVHRVVWQQTFGAIPLGPNGKPMDLDHRPNCPRHCANPLHVEPVTRRVNVQRMHRTRGHQTAAD